MNDHLEHHEVALTETPFRIIFRNALKRLNGTLHHIVQRVVNALRPENIPCVVVKFDVG